MLFQACSRPEHAAAGPRPGARHREACRARRPGAVSLLGRAAGRGAGRTAAIPSAGAPGGALDPCDALHLRTAAGQELHDPKSRSGNVEQVCFEGRARRRSWQKCGELLGVQDAHGRRFYRGRPPRGNGSRRQAPGAMRTLSVRRGSPPFDRSPAQDQPFGLAICSASRVWCAPVVADVPERGAVHRARARGRSAS